MSSLRPPQKINESGLRWLLAGVACLLALVCLGAGGYTLVAAAGHGGSAPRAAALADQGGQAGAGDTGDSSTAAAQAGQAEATQTATAGGKAGRVGLPLHLAIPAIGLDAQVVTYTADDAAQGQAGDTGQPCLNGGLIVCFDPPTLDLVYWQQGGVDGVELGGLPGEDATDTVYLHGHAGVPGAGAVFDRLGQLVPGDLIELTTIYGVLTYEVTESWQFDRAQAQSDGRLAEQVPGRLVLIESDHRDGAEGTGQAAQGLAVVAEVVVGRASTR
ncbi:MAG: class F sortase [Bifidobacteriaceae bacterium]|jgi:hypothetical protein|nr:class F sortase [Bifidobacteriaceae bacterium]